MTIINNGLELPISLRRAREIMGKSFFGIEEAVKHFGVNPTQEQLVALSEIPFSEEVLEQTKNTHILVAVFPLSILEIRGKMQNKGLLYNQDWYNKEPFAKEPGHVSWQLVRKTPVPNSTSKNWQEQQSLLSSNDEVPTAQVMVYTIIGHHLSTGKRLFEKVYVRCSDVSSLDYHVYVGCFDSAGLDVSNYWGGYRNNIGVGLASARKFNPS